MRGGYLIGVVLAAAAAGAQEMGLDLTDATDYRPTLGIVGVAAVDASLPEGIGEKLKVDKVSDAAVAVAEKLALYQSVVGPGDAFAKLADLYMEALSCAEAACMRKVAEALDVNQVLVGQLVSKDGNAVLRVQSYTRYRDVLDTAEVPARSARDLEKQATTAFEASLKKAAGVLAVLKVKSGTASATARLDGHALGAVPFEKPVPAGNWKLTVEALGHLSDELDVELKAGETKEVEANLVPKPPDAPVASAPLVVQPESPSIVEETSAPKGPSLFTRPGLYVAAGGALLATVGFALGVQAKGVEARARDDDGDGALDITRREANAAHTQATLANILVPLGAASLAGGVVWMFVAPGKGRLSGEPDAVAMAGVGGTWP